MDGGLCPSTSSSKFYLATYFRIDLNLQSPTVQNSYSDSLYNHNSFGGIVISVFLTDKNLMVAMVITVPNQRPVV